MTEKQHSSYVIPIIILVIASVLSSFFIIVYPKINSHKTYLTIGGGVFDARLAINDEDRQNGLSGVKELKQNEALLMVFPRDDEWGIWMKDMEMPIDVVWLDSDGKVVFIVTDLMPDDPDKKTYRPEEPARYVLEFAAGTVENFSINEKSVANFAIDSSLRIE